MKKSIKSTLYKFSKERREFLKTAIGTGISLGAAISLSNKVFADELQTRPLDTEYEYIVVGSGSAGAVIADRLSEAGLSVLLIEAGTGDIQQEKLSQPHLWFHNLGSDTDWSYSSLPQKYLNQKSIHLASGKALGGSGSINAAVWLRPDVRDLEILNRVLGEKWCVDNLYSAYRRVENFTLGHDYERSYSGKVTVGRYSHHNPLSQASILAANEIGIESTDHNASRYIDGSGFADVNIEPNGIRSGPAQTYIRDALNRPNFDVITDSLVTKILIEGSVCSGIEFSVDGETHAIGASREVILSAGSFGSPKLLMLSGVGEAKHLTRQGLVVKQDLPAVGKNLQDHMVLTGIGYYGGEAYSSDITIGTMATHTFVSTRGNESPPDGQITCAQSPLPPDVTGGRAGFSLLPQLAKVKSRGYLTIRSKDPREKLIVDPRYLSNRHDRDAFVNALDIALAMGESASLREFIDSPAFSRSSLNTPTEKLAFISQNTVSGLHFVGSCRAGSDHRECVVDQNLKVWGVDNLRVVDASILPETPGVNPQTLIMTIAELASEIILQSK